VEGSRKPQHVNVLAPYLAQVFALKMESASIRAYWKEARLSPLYKKAGPGPGELSHACSEWHAVLAVCQCAKRFGDKLVRC